MPTPSKKTRGSAVVDLSEHDFARFRQLFYDRTGIDFGANKRYFVDRRLDECRSKAGMSSFDEYLDLLKRDATPAGIQALVNAMTVNETYFFREDYQFNALTQALLPELAKERGAGSTLRIWSMPCSTGEEPYSIAINILENWAEADAFNIEIHASDIDTHVLARARKGVYGARSLTRVPAAVRQRYFRALSADTFQICDGLRGSIDFSTVNVVDERAMAEMRDFDVIFCRNMLIYFDDESRRRAVDLLSDALAPGGYLCLGHSESMSRISRSFQTRSIGGNLVYRKPRLPNR